MKNTIVTFLDNIWELAIRFSEVWAGVFLLKSVWLETMFGKLPMHQVIGAILIADAVVYFYRLKRATNAKKK